MTRSFAGSMAAIFMTALLAACGGGAQQQAANTYPDRPEDIQPLLVGVKAPSFTVNDAQGKAFHFDPDNLDAPVLLIFYRGGWCPFCNKHLMRLNEIEDEMLALGYDALFLSADSVESIQEHMGDKERDLSYSVLSDNDLVASTAFGLTYYVNDEYLAELHGYGHDIVKESGRDHRLLPVPAVYIVNTDGTIAFQYVNPNYKIRLEPSVILAAAKAVVEGGEGI